MCNPSVQIQFLCCIIIIRTPIVYTVTRVFWKKKILMSLHMKNFKHRATPNDEKKIRTQILSSGKSQFQINFSFKEFFVNFYFYFELDSRKILYEVSGGFLPFQSQWKCSYEKRIALFTCNLSFDLSTNCLGPLFQKRAYWTKNWENSPKTIFEKNSSLCWPWPPWNRPVWK